MPTQQPCLALGCALGRKNTEKKEKKKRKEQLMINGSLSCIELVAYSMYRSPSLTAGPDQVPKYS